ncbi:MAG: diguanylate cyclase [bacterium]|nr:diguanylate cyclase [bacterium]
MKMEEKRKILFNFLKSKEWFLLSDILDDLGSCYRIVDNGYEIIYRKRDNELCQALSENTTCNNRCTGSYMQISKEAVENNEILVKSCYMGFIEFASPLIIQDEIIGTISGCQIIDSDISEDNYINNFEKYGISKEVFYSYYNSSSKCASNTAKNEIKLVSLLARLAIEKDLIGYKFKERDCEIQGIIDSYKLFEASQSSNLELTEKLIYNNITNITAKALDAEICSLMIIDQEKEKIYIEDAIGLDKKIVSKVSLRLGEGIVGHVIKSGTPLLVKDIDKDNRFGKKHQSKRYYTRSLIVAPLKIKGEVIGAININNKSTRHPFDEEDLELLNVICGHAAAAIENLRSCKKRVEMPDIDQKYKEMQVKLEEYRKLEETKIDKEDLKNKDKLIDSLKEQIKDLSKLRDTTEEEVIMLRDQREQIEKQLQQEREKIKYYQEELRLLKEAKSEVIDKGTGHEEELVRIKKEAEEYRKIYEEIKKVTQLQREAEKDKDTENVEKYKEMLHELDSKKEKLGEMEEKTKELNMLFNITKGLISTENPANILEWSLDSISSFYNYHAASFIYQEGYKNIAVIKLTYPLGEECVQDLKENIQNSWAGMKKNKKIKKLKFEIIKSNFTTISTQTKERISSYIFAPIKERKRVIGLMNINNIKEYAYSAIDKRLLAIVANQISMAIERAKLFERIKDSAEKDELTKLYNYRYFERYFENVFKKNIRFKKSLSLIMIDFDHLKKVNDEYGHAQGNRLIKTIAGIIKKKIGKKGVVVRFGGDEFAIVLPETNEKKAFEIALDIKNGMNSYSYKVRGKDLRLSASMGIAFVPHEEIKEANELFKRADKAVYIAKEQGRDRVIIYSSDKKQEG